jgi:hypothetical protein
MSSPFPGMDPYIEGPDIWSDFHNRFADEVSARLNNTIQPRYVARLVPYVTYEEVLVAAKPTGIRPDVGIFQAQPARGRSPVATAVAIPEPVESRVALEFPLRLMSIEVRATATMEFVTAIEILSPVNKRPSHAAYRDYTRKRQDLLRSSAHFIEIDLLRGGTRPALEEPVPDAPYYITLSRANRRPHVSVWPIQLQNTLPTLPVPLTEPDPDVLLDLNAILAAVYERGGYGSIIDYHQPPPPPQISAEEEAWLDQYLRAEGIR